MVLDELLTTGQIMKRSGYVRETICLAVREGRLEAAGKLPGRNGAYLFTAAAVEEWLAARRTKPFRHPQNQL